MIDTSEFMLSYSANFSNKVFSCMSNVYVITDYKNDTDVRECELTCAVALWNYNYSHPGMSAVDSVLPVILYHLKCIIYLYGI